ncbi:group III truncated hemoglobin [Coralloluteibacterium thermophilus]|uniref:Group III truncated hemoglobin n=1 Tax=Coralloluteibacterium thermophilum TaxID=2707049 RepID=A0ABV9NJZ5_9GAMM
MESDDDRPRPGPELCTEAEVERLVHGFYARVRADAVLGPLFERHVDDWPEHLAQLVDFWSAMLRGTRRFRGAPVQRHLALPGLDAGLFARWLALFRATTAEMGNPVMREVADAAAERVAGTLLARYRVQSGRPDDGNAGA